MIKLNKKGDTEIISQILIILIIVIVVGIFVRAIIPIIEEYQEKSDFDKSQDYILKIEETINEILNKPINSTTQLHLNLNNLTLEIDSNTNKIQIIQDIKYDIFKENFTQQIDSKKYNYRINQELYSVLDFNSIDIIRSRYVENKNITLHIKKIDKGVINISLNVEDDNIWFGLQYNNNNFSYSNVEEDGQWYYRKLITIDNNKIEGDLNSFPMLVDLNADKDLYNYAKEDASDIMFTDTNGNKLYREIEVFDKYTLFRKKITIDHTKVDDDLTNFPMLINITDSDLSTYSNEFGSDIYFKDSEGNKLKREIEDFNKETGDLTVWVKIPELLSSEDTNIYMYFGNLYAGEEDSTEVWDENYKGVWHLKENPSEIAPQIKDSTGINKGTTEGVMTLDDLVDGKISKNLNFDGSNDSINLGTHSSLNITGELTMEAWIKKSADPISNRGIFGKWWSYTGNNDKRSYDLMEMASTKTPAFRISNDGTFTNSNTVIGNTTLNIGEWYHLVGVYSPSNYLKLYINGNLDNSLDSEIYNSSYSNINYPVIIGLTFIPGGTNKYFEGLIDEVRISNKVRSRLWISTEYNNQNDPSSFYSIEDKEDLGNFAKITAWVNIPQIKKEQNNSLYLYFGNDLANENNSTKVWDENYVMVQHLNENPDNDQVDGFLDSSSYQNHGIAYYFDNTKLSTPGINCKFGNCVIFDGIDDKIKIFDNGDLNYFEEFTLNTWINTTNLKSQGDSGTGYGIIGNSQWNEGGYFIGIRNSETGYFGFGIQEDGDSYEELITNQSYNENEWINLKIVYKNINNEYKIYINGEYIWTEPATLGVSLRDFTIGDIPQGGWSNYIGKIDESRVESIARSENWISTEYNNQNEPNTFYNLGDLEKK